MASYNELVNLQGQLFERDIAAGIQERIAAELPDLTDFSPSAPQVVIGEGVAWGSALALYYAYKLPEVFEEYILRKLYGASEKPATPSVAWLKLRFATVAPSGGRNLPAGTTFRTPAGLMFTMPNSYTYPPDVYGDEAVGSVPVYLIPVKCNESGAATNVPAGAISVAATTLAGLTSVTNPEPAYNGTDLQTYAEMRVQYFTQAADRLLVTPGDFERFFRRDYNQLQVYIIQPLLPNGASDPSWQAGKLKIVGVYPDNTPLTSNPSLRTYLQSFTPSGEVLFVPPAYVTVNINANISFDTRVTNQTDVDTAVRTALAAYLRPYQWKYWGKAVYKVFTAEIIALLKDITGVLGVTLNSPNADVQLPAPYSAPILGANPTLTYTAL